MQRSRASWLVCWILACACPALAQSPLAERTPPAPVVAGGPSVVLPGKWDLPTALAAGGHSLEIDDLRRLLSSRGTPTEDLRPASLKPIYEGIAYLEKLPVAVAALKPLNNLSTKNKVACGGWPDGLFFRAYDGRWAGVYSRVCVVTDASDQVLAVEFVSENGRYVPAFMTNVSPEPGNWHLIDIVQARVKAKPGIAVEMRVVKTDNAIVVNTIALSHTSTLFAGKHLVNLILHCTEKQATRASGTNSGAGSSGGLRSGGL